MESECEYHEINIDYWANDNGVVLLADEDTTINTNVTLSQQIIQLLNRSSHQSGAIHLIVFDFSKIAVKIRGCVICLCVIKVFLWYGIQNQFETEGYLFCYFMGSIGIRLFISYNQFQQRPHTFIVL